MAELFNIYVMRCSAEVCLVMIKVATNSLRDDVISTFSVEAGWIIA